MRARAVPSTRPFFDDHLERMLEPILDAAIDSTRAHFGNIQVRTPHHRHLRLVAQRGFNRPFLDFFHIVADDGCACGSAMKHARAVVVPDVAASPIYSEPARRVMLDAGALACQSTPIVTRARRVLGMLSTHYRTPHQPSRMELIRVEALARRAADLLDAPRATGHAAAVSRLIDEWREQSSKTHTIRARGTRRRS